MIPDEFARTLADLDLAELAQEFLRRNPTYREQYRALMTGNAKSETTEQLFARAWGLEFRSRPRCASALPSSYLA